MRATNILLPISHTGGHISNIRFTCRYIGKNTQKCSQRKYIYTNEVRCSKHVVNLQVIHIENQLSYLTFDRPSMVRCACFRAGRPSGLPADVCARRRASSHPQRLHTADAARARRHQDTRLQLRRSVRLLREPSLPASCIFNLSRRGTAFVRSFVRSFVHSFVHSISFSRTFVRSFVRSFVRMFVHSI